MPMYEYRCGECGYGVERYAAARTGAEKAEKCPRCSQASLKKVFSTFAANCGCGSGASVPSPTAGCGGGSGHFS